MNCLTKLFQQKRRRIGYILAFSGPMISKRDSSEKMKLFFYRKFIRFVIKHFTIVINNTIQMNGGQYIEHMNNYQGKEDEKCLDKE